MRFPDLVRLSWHHKLQPDFCGLRFQWKFHFQRLLVMFRLVLCVPYSIASVGLGWLSNLYPVLKIYDRKYRCSLRCIQDFTNNYKSRFHPDFLHLTTFWFPRATVFASLARKMCFIVLTLWICAQNGLISRVECIEREKKAMKNYSTLLILHHSDQKENFPIFRVLGSCCCYCS